jgi:hypothetical protein
VGGGDQHPALEPVRQRRRPGGAVHERIHDARGGGGGDECESDRAADLEGDLDAAAREQLNEALRGGLARARPGGLADAPA